MHFEDGQTVGIDLGTTFSTLAYLDAEGRPVPVANDEGDVETPSLILLVEGRHVVVGPNRARAAVEDPQNVIERIKRHMGEIDFRRFFDGQEITPEFISALILKKLKQDAEAKIGKIGNAVVTVPYYFNDARRKATEDAGRIAGVNVIGIINEPTAATLAYAWDRGELGATGTRLERPKTALVYDLGGGTFDVTLVSYTPTHFQVLATDGDVHLGGVDWNDRLAEHIAQEFESRYGQDIRQDPATMQLLRNDCDLAKIALSQSNETMVTCRHAGKALSLTITRDMLEQLTADLLQRTIDTLELVLEQAKLTPEQIDAVVLVGGSTLMPSVQKRVAEAMGKAPYRGLSPHTAVAQGAAIHAAILDIRNRGEKSVVAEQVRRHLGSVRQDDVNSHSLGIVIKNPKTGKASNHIMIPRNSKLPVEVSQCFYTNHPNQQRVNVQVIEGDAPDPAACSLIGNCRITDLPANLPQGSPIEVTYSFTREGRVNVRAKDQAGGREAAISIDRKGGLSDEQIDAYTRLAQEYKVD